MTATPAPPAGARILTGNLPGIASMAALALEFPEAEALLADWTRRCWSRRKAT